MILLYLHIFLSCFVADDPSIATIKHNCTSIIEACDSSKHVHAVEVEILQLFATSNAKEKISSDSDAVMISNDLRYSIFIQKSLTRASLAQPIDDIVLRFCNLRL